MNQTEDSHSILRDKMKPFNQEINVDAHLTLLPTGFIHSQFGSFDQIDCARRRGAFADVTGNLSRTGFPIADYRAIKYECGIITT